MSGNTTLNATLQTDAGTPIDGVTVTFTIKDAAGTVVDTETSDLTVNGVATKTFPTTLAAGDYTLTASFAGNTTFAASTSTPVTMTITAAQTATEITAVSGTATQVGATEVAVTAKLTEADGVTALPVGTTVDFAITDLAGNPVPGATGSGTITDNTGVVNATVTVPATFTGAFGHVGTVTASFAGDTTFAPAQATGDVTISPAVATDTQVTLVSGTAVQGQPATLTATLTTTDVTPIPIAGETVDFTLSDGTTASAVTDANGVATVANVTTGLTSSPLGIQAGAVTANFTGVPALNLNAALSPGTGNLAVSPAAATPTQVTDVMGTGTVNPGDSTVSARLTTTDVTPIPIAGATVTFTLSDAAGTQATAVTDANGLATTTITPTPADLTQGNSTLTATYAGDLPNLEAPITPGTGTLTINQTTALSNVTLSGTSATNGATLTATLLEGTGAPVPVPDGELVHFVVFDSSGNTVYTSSPDIPTVSGVATTTTTLPDGTYSMTVSYAGSTTNFLAAAPDVTVINQMITG